MQEEFHKASMDRIRPGLMNGAPKYQFPFATFVEITRPANANAYTANDIINETVAKPLEFQNIVSRPGGAFCITNSLIVESATPGTALTAFVMLFSERVVGPADHATLALDQTMMKSLIGVLNINTQVKGATGCIYTPPWNDPVYGRCANNETSIWGIVMSLAAWTPASSEYLRVYLSGFEYS